MTQIEKELESIYRGALARCDPERLVRERLARAPARFEAVIALGKAAVKLCRGASPLAAERGFVAVPEGYLADRELPRGVTLFTGNHPQMGEESFAAGEALQSFADSLRGAALVLLSGGASAAVEAPLAPHFTRDELSAVNHALLRSGLPIEQINIVRKHLSAIKGGRLGARLPEASEVWVLSDVKPGMPEVVASGPVSADRSTNSEAADIAGRIGLDEIAERLRDPDLPETVKDPLIPMSVLADNLTLIDAAEAAAGERKVLRVNEPMDDDVETVASRLLGYLQQAAAGTLVIAGGEPTVRVTGEGRGGRCSEVAARLLRQASRVSAPPFTALVGSSDGRDGNSGVAGCVVTRRSGEQIDEASFAESFGSSDTYALIGRHGRAIMMRPTGNNLRDLMLVARG